MFSFFFFWIRTSIYFSLSVHFIIASLLIRQCYISQGYFLNLVSAAFSFSSNHTNSATTWRSIVTTLSSTLLRHLHLWFHTDLLISVCNFVYVFHLIKPWFILFGLLRSDCLLRYTSNLYRLQQGHWVCIKRDNFNSTWKSSHLHTLKQSKEFF